MACSEMDSNYPFNICPLCHLKVGVLGTTVASVMMVTTKVAICLYVNKMMFTATMAEFKLEVAHSAPNTIMVTSTMGWLLNPAQIRLLLSQWRSKLYPAVFFHMALLATMITHNLTSSRILRWRLVLSLHGT